MDVFYRKRRRFERFMCSGVLREFEVTPEWEIDPVTTTDPGEIQALSDAADAGRGHTVTAQDGTRRQVLVNSLRLDGRTGALTVVFQDPGIHPAEPVPWAEQAGRAAPKVVKLSS